MNLPAPLLDALLENRVLPVIGAGFSLNATLPAGRRMPMWRELGEQLEGEVDFPVPGADAVEVLSAYAAQHGRQALVDRLRRALHDDVAKPGEAHRAFARLPFDVVITTNFDGLLEDAYREVRRPLRTLIREDQLASPVPRRAVTLVKAHGDYDNEPVLVATEEDYDSFLIRRPLLATYLANLLITRVALLIGYSLSDPDWRQLLSAVRSRLGRSQQAVYAVEVEPSLATMERFRRRGVTVIPLAANGLSHGEVLERMFVQFRAHIAAHALDQGTVREEGALEELRGTARHERRLVLFLVPERLLAFYREQVFPALREIAAQPITPYDVDAPGVGLYSVATALIEEASLVVADMTRGETGVTFELGLALTADAERRGRLAIVSSRSGDDHRAVNEGVVQFLRDPLEDDEVFVSALREWVRVALGEAERDLRARPGDVGADISWAIIRAFRNLELALRERYPDGRGPMLKLLRQARAEGVLDDTLFEKLSRARQLRNLVLHEGVGVERQQAIAAVLAIEEAIENLSEADNGGAG